MVLGLMALGTGLVNPRPVLAQTIPMYPSAMGNPMPPVPMPRLFAEMDPDPEVDASRRAILAQVNAQCTPSTAQSLGNLAPNPDLDTPEKQIVCRLRSVAPMAIGVGFTLAAERMAQNAHRASMTPDQVRQAMARVQVALPGNQVGGMVDQLWQQHAEDCGAHAPGEAMFACEQAAQFNAGFRIGVSMYVSGEAARMFEDLKGPSLVAPAGDNRRSIPPRSTPVMPHTLSTRRPSTTP